MRLIFERGDERRPRGHALIYFRDPDSPAVLATYLVIPPVSIDFSKYLPPMFAGQGMAANLAQASSIVPLPPVPEGVASAEALRVLADQRDDDLVLAGDASPGQVEMLITVTSEASQLYFHLYQDYARGFPEAPVAPAEAALEAPSTEEVTYALMSERERLGELARLAGMLRYSLDGNDRRQTEDLVARMRLLGKHLPAKYWPDQVIDAASTAGASGSRLSELYIDRCYKLVDEDYASVARIEGEITSARSEGPRPSS